MISATLMECTSPADPPDTVKSWLARCTSRPPTEAAPVTTPSAGKLLPAMPNSVARCSANSPVSSKLSGSTSASTRSRAVSLPPCRCFSSLSAPPPSMASLACASRQFVDFLLHGMNGHMNSLSNAYFDRRHGDLVRLAVALDVVGDGGRAPDPCRCPAVRVSAARRARQPAARRDPCPGSSGPWSRVAKNLGATWGNIA